MTSSRRSIVSIGRSSLHWPNEEEFPPQFIRAWSGSLRSLKRQVHIGGYLLGDEHASTTGYPEGDPLSVTALFILVWCFGWTLSERYHDVEFRAYADNWN